MALVCLGEPEQSMPTEAISSAIRIIDAHSAIDYRRMETDSECRGITAVHVDVRPSLPNQWRSRGSSENGVLAREPVTLFFPSLYPFKAPTIRLRHDFPREFPHIFPGPLSKGPVPCLYDGDLSELLQREGFASILNQLVVWIENAALERLIDPAQGWEPTRRDTCQDLIVANTADLRAQVTQMHGGAIFGFNYGYYLTDVHALRWFGKVSTDRIRLRPQVADSLFYEHQLDGSNGLRFGASIAILTWPPEKLSGKAVFADRYCLESVTDIASLLERAAELGCSNRLGQRLDWLRTCLPRNPLAQIIPIVVVLCARRPTHLINSNSNLELCCYLAQMRLSNANAMPESTPVRPAALCDAITPSLLMSLSGDSSDTGRLPWIQVGAGSLGSKIALHLARAGRAPSVVIDFGHLKPHNAARHGLIPDPKLGQSSWIKATALAHAIKCLDQDVQAYPEDIVRIAHDRERTEQLLPSTHWAIVNSTASLAVREALSALPTDAGVPRIIETSLYAKGRIAILSVEGKQRNPDTGDLATVAHRVMLVENEVYRSLVVRGDETLQRHIIGEGCGSLTTAMSDAEISLLAAPMARILAELQKSSLPDASGQIHLGTVADDGCSVSWTVRDVTPWKQCIVEGEPQWKVRFSAEVDQKIRAECACWKGLETGGILIGGFSEATQTFRVTDLLPAPADSRRTRSKFILGTEGVLGKIEEFESTGLLCLGTWHSHLSESGPSWQDRKTADRIGQSRTMPSILLIRTPKTYRAVLAKPKPLALDGSRPVAAG